MEITNSRFDGNLLPILEAISESLFVAIDLEFSGIPDRSASNRGTQTTEIRYQELRHAAKRYWILQVGLTCCSEVFVDSDHHHSATRTSGNADETSASHAATPGPRYILKTYNFTLNPCIDSSLGITRRYVCDSAAMQFLVSNGFDVTKSFKAGVGYLSSVEERQARVKFEQRVNRVYDDIIVEVDDEETRNFLDRVRARISVWEKSGKDVEPLTISSRKASERDRSLIDAAELDANESDDVSTLTNFDKRLIHQLVRKEYPQLLSIGLATSMIIKPVDPMREAAIQRAKAEGFRRDVVRHRGFGWIIRALLGQDVSGLDVRTFARDPMTGEPFVYDLGSLQSRFDRTQHWLAARRPVIVGHNVFVDLVYIYQHFVDELPETLPEFVSIIHDLFPLIVDTKFLSTHDCGRAVPQSRLEEIEQALRGSAAPNIEMASSFDKYADEEGVFAHEAGYDSMLTARIMVQLSAGLGQKYATTMPSTSSSSLFDPPMMGSDAAADQESKSLAMPSFSDEEFWCRFGNKLRAFGTIERVVDLSMALPKQHGIDSDREILW